MSAEVLLSEGDRERQRKIERDAMALIEAYEIYQDNTRLEKAQKFIKDGKKTLDEVAKADEEYLKALGIK
jgi:DNA-binding transcriptional regulator GbsR (MarR family)